MGSSALANVSRVESTAAMVERVAVMLAEVKASLPEVTDIPALLELRAKSDAMRVFLRQRDAALASQLDAAEIKLRTERRLGELVADIPALPNDGKRGNQAGPAAGPGKTVVLAEMGISKQRANEWKKLAAVPAEDFARATESVRAKGSNVTSAKAAIFSSESDEWYTPDKYLASVRAVLGVIDIDPASNPKANEIVGAKRIFTIDDDGLIKPWKGSVFLNPPYGEEAGGMAVWISKMIVEAAAGRLTHGILLCNATTDAAWFQPLWDYAICFTDHRIKFYTPSGTPRSPVAGNAFVYFGDALQSFKKEFSQHGVVVRRVR